MAERKLTFLELHFNDAQIGPKWIGGKTESEAEEAEAAAEREATGDLDVESGRKMPASPKTLLGLVAAIGLMGGFAVAAKVIAGKRGADQTTLDDPSFEDDPEVESTEIEE